MPGAPRFVIRRVRHDQDAPFAVQVNPGQPVSVHLAWTIFIGLPSAADMARAGAAALATGLTQGAWMLRQLTAARELLNDDGFAPATSPHAQARLRHDHARCRG